MHLCLVDGYLVLLARVVCLRETWEQERERPEYIDGMREG